MGFAATDMARAGEGFSSSGLFLPIDPALIIADWISDLGVAGTGSAVTSWTDQVNGNVLAQASGPARPTFVSGAAPSGRSAIRFDGLAHFLAQATFDLSSLLDVDFWVVGLSTLTGAQQNIVDFDGLASGGIRAGFFRRTTDEAATFTNGNVGFNSEDDTDVLLLDTARVYNLRAIPSQGGSEAEGYVDAALTRFDTAGISNDNTNANAGSGPLRIGQRAASAGGGVFFGGDLYRVAAVQPTAPRSTIAQFFADTYGVP